jgi:hypothetical protein
MADPVRHKDRDIYLARAEQARAEADEATLENVRDRCLRSEAAWRDMADRAARTDRMKVEQAAAKAAQSAGE